MASNSLLTEKASNYASELKKFRLTIEEFDQMVSLLGRAPKGVEWSIFSALWSEHCSYKSSRVHLKKLFNTSPRVLNSFGENAGVLDLGEGEKIAFKIESHNHPSYIEPYQGAATGVGGIIRDILTMGARPIALGNFLCFGSAKNMTKYVDGVVRGIGGYGNCVGVPMLTGQTEFRASYDKNILVNAFCLGYFGPNDPVIASQASGFENLVVYVGAKTGRDGIHGARMASESFDQTSESKRPTIQIGDPFFEKLLIEAFLEVVGEGLVLAAQDMGAAGLISSTFEMAAKGGSGFELNLDLVPLRDPTLTADDILVSESQERMILICLPKHLLRIQEIFHRWGLDAVCIGKILETKNMKLIWKNEVIADIDPQHVVESAPRWNRPYHEHPTRLGEVELPTPNNDLLAALSSPQGCSRAWISEQYDQHVGVKTVRDCSDSVGVLRLPSGRPLAIALGGRPALLDLNSYIGGADSIAEPLLRISALGFEAVGISDGLNFGNPENPRVMGDFKSALDGMNQVAKLFKVPIISGNVSFYNETNGQNITPTPCVSVVGLGSKNSSIPNDYFTTDDLKVYLIRSTMIRNTGTWSEVRGDKNFEVVRENVTPERENRSTGTGELDFSRIKALSEKLFELSPTCDALQMSGKFGLAYTLARMSIKGERAMKFTRKLDAHELFEERLYEFVAVARTSLMEVKHKDFEIIEIGVTGGNQLLRWNLKDLSDAYHGAWGKIFEELS